MGHSVGLSGGDYGSANSFVTHKKAKLRLVDLSNCTPAEVTQVCHLAPGYVTAEPRGSLLLLADFSGAKFDKGAIASLKEGTVYDRPHLKRSAWVAMATPEEKHLATRKSSSFRLTRLRILK